MSTEEELPGSIQNRSLPLLLCSSGGSIKVVRCCIASIPIIGLKGDAVVAGLTSGSIVNLKRSIPGLSYPQQLCCSYLHYDLAIARGR